MKFGVCIPNYGATSSTESLSQVALEAERLGYDSVWTTDHLLMPRNSGTPYERIYDSVATLAFIAAQTKKVRLGISSLIIAMRNPVAVAKQLATIDSFSGGRTLLAIGAGWNEKEFGFVGSDFHDRGRRVDGSIRLIRSLWRGETKFEDERLPQRFQDAVFEPAPQRKDVEVWVGGTSDAAMKRSIKLGDAWHPNVFPMETFRPLVSRFRELTGGKKVDVCVRIALDVRAERAEYVGVQGDRRITLTGNMAENIRVIHDLEALGVSYAVLVPSPQGKTDTKDQLDSIGRFAEKFVA
ncbi:MAG: TIGR03619 family F420-dependent LLM class oxidoreductase [Nitrososphaerota archaeon]|jgi:probable F420-dependent oxidoreductase|nr:TIGR03619 family F420-dependent LLM class oxidoreductase [Nitrososphaerota archaeon]